MIGQTPNLSSLSIAPCEDLFKDSASRMVKEGAGVDMGYPEVTSLCVPGTVLEPIKLSQTSCEVHSLGDSEGKCLAQGHTD